MPRSLDTYEVPPLLRDPLGADPSPWAQFLTATNNTGDVTQLTAEQREMFTLLYDFAQSPNIAIQAETTYGITIEQSYNTDPAAFTTPAGWTAAGAVQWPHLVKMWRTVWTMAAADLWDEEAKDTMTSIQINAIINGVPALAHIPTGGTKLFRMNRIALVARGVVAPGVNVSDDVAINFHDTHPDGTPAAATTEAPGAQVTAPPGNAGPPPAAAPPIVPPPAPIVPAPIVPAPIVPAPIVPPPAPHVPAPPPPPAPAPHVPAPPPAPAPHVPAPPAPPAPAPHVPAPPAPHVPAPHAPAPHAPAAPGLPAPGLPAPGLPGPMPPGIFGVPPYFPGFPGFPGPQHAPAAPLAPAPAAGPPGAPPALILGTNKDTSTRASNSQAELDQQAQKITTATGIPLEMARAMVAAAAVTYTASSVDPNPHKCARDLDPNGTKSHKDTRALVRSGGGAVVTWSIDGLGSQNGTPEHAAHVLAQPVWHNKNSAPRGAIMQGTTTWSDAASMAAEAVHGGGWFNAQGLSLLATGIYIEPTSVLGKLIHRGELPPELGRQAAAACFAAGLFSERQLAELCARETTDKALEGKISELLAFTSAAPTAGMFTNAMPAHTRADIMNSTLKIVRATYKSVSGHHPMGYFDSVDVRAILAFAKDAASAETTGTSSQLTKAWFNNAAGVSNEQALAKVLLVIGEADDEGEAMALIASAKETVRSWPQSDLIYHVLPLFVIFSRRGYRIDGKAYEPREFISANIQTITALIARRKAAYGATNNRTRLGNDWELREDNTYKPPTGKGDLGSTKPQTGNEKTCTKEQHEEVRTKLADNGARDYVDPIRKRKLSAKVHAVGAYVYTKVGERGWKVEPSIFSTERLAERVPGQHCAYFMINGTCNPSTKGKKGKGKAKGNEQCTRDHSGMIDKLPENAKEKTWRAVLEEQIKRAVYA